MLQIAIPGEMIKLMGDWRSDYYERYLDVSIINSDENTSNVNIYQNPA